ncbi:putative ATP-dependent RNA helicase spindle-E [Papilio xuthus]|nr:putative ATP-dependent RNA helicase spindle-E [Papilio xuthus]
MGSTLTLHHTTLMPNIPGLPAIIALLFCPAAELRRDERCTRYVSTLCGLGSHDDGRPYFPEHDILVNIDVDLDVDDIGLINHVRHLMDYMMFCSEGQDTPTADDEFHPKVPKFIREDIMKLLRKRRKHRESCCVANAWRWRSADESELLEISVPGMAERALVFALHRPLELHAPPRTDLLRLYNANQALHNLLARTSSSSSQELTCELCNTGPLPAPAMRIHLYSNMHQEKEDDLRDVQS